MSAATLCAANLTRGLPLWLRFVAKSVSFGLSRLRWRAQSSSHSILSTRLRPFISSVTHTPSRKYALRSSFGHASLGNSKPTVSQSSSNRRSSTCSWTRCVVVMFPFLLTDVIFELALVLLVLIAKLAVKGRTRGALEVLGHPRVRVGHQAGRGTCTDCPFAGLMLGVLSVAQSQDN
jgi:hypothetical protein